MDLFARKSSENENAAAVTRNIAIYHYIDCREIDIDELKSPQLNMLYIKT